VGQVNANLKLSIPHFRILSDYKVFNSLWQEIFQFLILGYV